MTGQSSLARSPSPGLANSAFTLLEASSWSRNLAGPVELVHALSESAIHSGLRFGVSAQSHPQRLPAKLEFDPCLFRARFQLESCSDSAWLTVLNESVNLSRPTNKGIVCWRRFKHVIKKPKGPVPSVYSMKLRELEKERQTFSFPSLKVTMCSKDFEVLCALLGIAERQAGQAGRPFLCRV